jgi:hypothetical protein
VKESFVRETEKFKEVFIAKTRKFSTQERKFERQNNVGFLPELEYQHRNPSGSLC